MTAARAVVMRALGRFGDRRVGARGGAAGAGGGGGGPLPAAGGGGAGRGGPPPAGGRPPPRVARGTVCLRRLGGDRAGEARFGRLLANPAVSLERLLAGWGEPAAAAAAGRAHVLAVQDTTELRLRTTPERRRGLGEVGRGGRARGLLLHALLALDAGGGGCLGPVGGGGWARRGRVDTPHQRRPLAEKESRRWLATAERARDVLAGAGTVTVVADRESDIYAEWARLPGPGFHLLARAMQDRPLAGGGKLFAAGRGFPAAASRTVELPAAGPRRPAARRGAAGLRLGPRAPARAGRARARGLPAGGARRRGRVGPWSGTCRRAWRSPLWRSRRPTRPRGSSRSTGAC